MFGLKKRATADNQQNAQQQEQLAELSSQKIAELENKLTNNPRDSEIQKQLMLEYNRALSLFAKSRGYRNQIDSLFIKIDELRNVVRKSI
jgi:hypothetical protein